MPVYLRAKFEVFSTVLTSFRQGEGGGNLTTTPYPPLSAPTKRTPKNPTQIRIKVIPKKKPKSKIQILEYLQVCSSETGLIFIQKTHS